MKSAEEIEQFNKLMIQLPEMLNEFSALSKKKPDDPVNKFNLNFVNGIVKTANGILDEKNRPFADFELFDEDSLPSNSDVVLILSQYWACLKKFKKENIARVDLYNYWIIDSKISDIEV